MVKDEDPAAAGWVGTNPEKNPPARGWQGSEKEDCVTVWFLGKKLNSIFVPGAAMIFDGVYVRLLAPTLTWKGEDVAVTAGGAAAETREALARAIKVFVNCIMYILMNQ